jgi:hypothetical protein
MNMKKRKLFLIGLVIATIFSFGYIKYNNMNSNDVGLAVLGWVKKIKGNEVDLNTINSMETPTMQHEDWNTLLQKHVTKSGQVNYKGFIQDRVIFNKYIAALTSHPAGKNWSEKEIMAYWINAYNAFTVKLILDNYPLKSIKDIVDGLPMINSPWDIKFFKIGNTNFDLNTIEHEILRKEFNEPRIHFAINCASVSCPKLRNEAFTAENLELQLEDQANYFINNPNKNNITASNVKLSKIFDWFRSDFTKEKPFASFLQNYTNIKLSTNFNVEYLDYDWTLNE